MINKKNIKEEIDLTCPICGKKFKQRKWKYNQNRICCSSECGHKLGGFKLSQHRQTKYYECRIERVCLNCGKHFWIRKSTINRKDKKRSPGKYCSKKCTLEMRCKLGMYLKEKNPNWNGGLSKMPYSFNFDKKLKEKIRKRDGYVCQECGLNEGLLSKKLHIHHIDYNKNNNNNNNLISLCNSCHSQTNFTRKQWQEYFINKLRGTINV